MTDKPQHTPTPTDEFLMRDWSTPFCGVSHLGSTGKFQVTIEQYSTFTTAYVLCLQTSKFKPIAERDFSDRNEAMRWAREQYLALKGCAS